MRLRGGQSLTGTGRGSARAVALGAVIALSFGASSGMLVARLASASGSPTVTSAPGPAPRSEPVAVRASETPQASPTPTRRAAPPMPTSCGSASARTVKIRVAVQRRLPTTLDAFARGVMAVLCDPRSWIASGRVRFVYDPSARNVVRLLSAAETEQACRRLTGLSVFSKFSCAGSREVVLNADRWFGGSPWWPGSVAQYRRLLVNHEVGHLIGQRHRGCGARGRPAPVMMQQSKGLGGCRANPWPTASELRTVR